MTEYQQPAENNKKFATLVDVARYRAVAQEQKTADTFLPTAPARRVT